MRIKFLDFKNKSLTEKKLKSFKKDLNDKFKSKINELKGLTLDQEKFNSLISELITNMSLDENIDEQEKSDKENENDDKQSKPQDQEQQAKEKEEKNEEMSIERGVRVWKMRQKT